MVPIILFSFPRLHDHDDDRGHVRGDGDDDRDDDGEDLLHGGDSGLHYRVKF